MNTAGRGLGAVKYTRSQRKRLSRDRQRYIRVVESFDFSGIIQNSPVEITEGYIVSDRDSDEVFACFEFMSVSEKPIKALDVKVLLYSGQNVPYEKLDFRYCAADASWGIRVREGENRPPALRINEPECVVAGECFGRASYIRIPERYFERISLRIVSARYSDGTTDDLDITVKNRARRLSECDRYTKYAFSNLNVFRAAEEKYPSVYLPESGESSWLCCCGHKNLISYSECERCHREKEWVLNSLAGESLERERRTVQNEEEAVLRKAAYRQDKYLSTSEEREKKAEEFEKAVAAIAEKERNASRMKWKLASGFLLLALIIFLMVFIANLYG